MDACFIKERSITIPPEHTPWPAKLWLPERIATTQIVGAGEFNRTAYVACSQHIERSAQDRRQLRDSTRGAVVRNHDPPAGRDYLARPVANSEGRLHSDDSKLVAHLQLQQLNRISICSILKVNCFRSSALSLFRFRRRFFVKHFLLRFFIGFFRH